MGVMYLSQDPSPNVLAGGEVLRTERLMENVCRQQVDIGNSWDSGHNDGQKTKRRRMRSVNLRLRIAYSWGTGLTRRLRRKLLPQFIDEVRAVQRTSFASNWV